MFWMVLLGCAGGVTEDSGESVDGFVKLFAGVNRDSPAYCALRADGTAVCFGDEFYVRDVPLDQGFLQILPSQQCGLQLDGEVLCWKDDWGLFGELPPGPYSRLKSNDPGTDGDPYVLALRQGSGELVFARDSDYTGEHIDLGTPVLDFASFGASLYWGCVVELDGAISCWPEAAAEGFYWEIPDGPFERIFALGLGYCALDPDGYANCFGDSFYDFDWEMVEAGPPLIEIEGPFLLTQENELVLADFSYPMGDDSIQEGDFFIDLTFSVHECAIPLDRPDSVECHRMDDYPMAVLPPSGTE
jgi:hypothetical protein